MKIILCFALLETSTSIKRDETDHFALHLLSSRSRYFCSYLPCTVSRIALISVELMSSDGFFNNFDFDKFNLGTKYILILEAL